MAPGKNPLEAAEQVVETVKDTVKDAMKEASAGGKHVPGVPGSEPPSVDQPVTPREPLPPKPDQDAPATSTANGTPTGAQVTARAQSGE